MMVAGLAFAQDKCMPSNPEDTKIVDRGSVKTVVDPLANFNPCHSSVKLDTPSFFAKSVEKNHLWSSSPTVVEAWVDMRVTLRS